MELLNVDLFIILRSKVSILFCRNRALTLICMHFIGLIIVFERVNFIQTKQANMPLILKTFNQHSNLVKKISFFTIIAKLELHASLQQSFILKHLCPAIHGNQINIILLSVLIIDLILSLTVRAELSVGWPIREFSEFIYVIYIYSHINEFLTNA